MTTTAAGSTALRSATASRPLRSRATRSPRCRSWCRAATMSTPTPLSNAAAPGQTRPRRARPGEPPGARSSPKPGRTRRAPDPCPWICTLRGRASTWRAEIPVSVPRCRSRWLAPRSAPGVGGERQLDRECPNGDKAALCGPRMSCSVAARVAAPDVERGCRDPVAGKDSRRHWTSSPDCADSISAIVAPDLES